MASKQTKPNPLSIEPGIYYGMSDDDYRKIPAANQSTLKEMLAETPAHARYQSLFGETTDQMVLGTAFHTLVIDPETYFEKYVVWTGKTRAGKLWDAFQAKAIEDDKIVIRTVDDESLRLMATSLQEHPLASTQFTRGKERECVFVWEEGDILCKGKIDGLSADDYPTLTDLKTAASIKPEMIEKSVVNFGYDVQAAFYLRGAAALGIPNANFLFTFVETGGSPPNPRIVNKDDEPRHAVRVVELDTEALRRGEMICQQALELYQGCTTSKLWESYPSRIERITLPKWATREVDQ